MQAAADSVDGSRCSMLHLLMPMIWSLHRVSDNEALSSDSMRIVLAFSDNRRWTRIWKMQEECGSIEVNIPDRVSRHDEVLERMIVEISVHMRADISDQQLRPELTEKIGEGSKIAMLVELDCATM